MIIYVNGDSHSAGAEAVNNHCFAGDDSKYWQWNMRWEPHPDNLRVSYGRVLADMLGANLYCQARSAGSNDRIIRTTKEYLANNRPDAIVIGWTTWEREEWYDEETDFWYQVNGSGIDSVPKKWETRYKEFVISLDGDKWVEKTIDAHEKIWQFRDYLENLKIPYLFFNCHLAFDHIVSNVPRYEWGENYLDPYNSDASYLNTLCQLGFAPNKYSHFGTDAHKKWAEILHSHVTKILQKS
jgi:hypothetical protein